MLRACGLSLVRLPSVLPALPGAGQTGWPGAVARRARVWSSAGQMGSVGRLHEESPADGMRHAAVPACISCPAPAAKGWPA